MTSSIALTNNVQSSAIQLHTDTPIPPLPTSTLSGLPVEVIEQGVGSLPDEVVFHIFGFLSEANQGRASCVCWQWRNVAADDTLLTTSYLKKRYPLLQVLNEKSWKTLFVAKGLNFNDIPPLEPRMLPELDRLFRSLEIEGNAGITLAFLPSGLTCDMLIQPEFYTQDNPVNFLFSSRHRILEEFGKIPVINPRWFAITNNIVEGSGGLPLSEQQELVKTMGCDIPELLKVLSTATLTYKNSPEGHLQRAYNGEFYTRCLQQIGDNPVAVHSMSVNGPISVLVNFGCTRVVGMGAQWAF